MPITHLGVPVFRLVDDEGDFDTSFDCFREHLFNQEYARATIKRYLEVVAVFMDYLVEAGVYGVAVSELQLNTVVNQYVTLRLNSRRYLVVDTGADESLAEIARITRGLDFKPLSVAGNMVAAINLFLKLSEKIARAEWEKARAYGAERPSGSYRDMITCVDGLRTMTAWERKALKRSSTLANVIRLNTKGIFKPRGLSAGRQRQRLSDDEYLDFPLDRLVDLIGAATSARDETFWLLLASTGLRTSEAIRLTWSHIDIVKRLIFVEDPNGLRFSNELPAQYRDRFKGRAVSGTYILPFLKERLFEALERYVRTEYVPGAPDNYILQDIRSGYQGRPMHKMSDTSRIEAFKRAVARAGIGHSLPGRVYTPHSLRHMYGVFVLNYLPVPGGFGLTMPEVMKLLGHLTDCATRHYAREDRLVLAAKLQYADAQLRQPDLRSLPEFIAVRLEHEAARIRSRIARK